MADKQEYARMQRNYYEGQADIWSLENKNPVVGSFDKHNEWKDYDLLVEGIENAGEKKCLDFGCGPGRNIVKFDKYFGQIDGVDIAQGNLDKAKVWIAENGTNPKADLILCNGYDLSNIDDASYDVIISTITLQHICVYSIRFNYFREFYRILKDNGYLRIQMGIGQSLRAKHGYYENYYDANMTNGAHDCRIDTPCQVRTDLEVIGFTDFEYKIRPTGPGDGHQAWIFFSARK